PNIKSNFYYCDGASTVVKRRFVDPAFLNKLFEICYLEDANHLPKELEQEIFDYLDSTLKGFDLVIVTDFGHGLITPKIVKVLSEKAKFLAINVQTNSANLGYNLITKFHRADYICIDEPEIRLACHDKFSNLEHLIIEESKRANCDKIIITRGHKGSLAYSKKSGFVRIPVFSKEVVDRIGAGDAFFSITAPCACKDYSMEALGFIGNTVGATKVLIVGNRSSVEPVPLYKYITTLLK
ncbi:MAG: cytidyltransferase, partial [Candidatus Omnitrophica bacterium]|nr:cytidyltransferase [Candidatus Omnitrophota bacterium]